ncbi:glucose-6-phosphate dehydrogenase [Patescibacteria group bacterium]|nr:MAG: glucose-6-phosphate dehydrogenase [Patescibacteria group bacterium]
MEQATPINSEQISPTIFIICGVTGDLAQRKLLPALLSLYTKKLLPRKFKIVGFSRREFTDQDFRLFLREEMNINHNLYRPEDIHRFLNNVVYQQGQFDATVAYENLAKRLAKIDELEFMQCSNKLFHLSVAPSFYETILGQLSKSGLSIPCGGNLGWTRVLVEKPFGNDTETAKKLDALLGTLFKEEQIFRIDHYFAKEALQNVLAFRFSNSLFEPLWNNKHIECVHIQLLEKIGIEGRGNFYDGVGALKDVGQNHILAMLALLAMNRPETFDAPSIRKERAIVLKNLRAINSKNIRGSVVRGQYLGYVQEPGVSKTSSTETYFQLQAFVDTRAWKGVPFYLESGKGLSENKAEISIYFKDTTGEDKTNILSFRIQPDEAIKIRFWVKKPGFGMQTEAKTLGFNYKDSHSPQSIPDAYERVLYDAILGDQTLFTSTDEIKYAWKFITPIIDSWRMLPLEKYQRGSRGPEITQSS